MIDTTKLVEGERYLVRDKHDGDLVEIGVYCSNGMFSTRDGYQPTTAFDLAIPIALSLKAERLRAAIEEFIEELAFETWDKQGAFRLVDDGHITQAIAKLAALIADAKGGGE